MADDLHPPPPPPPPPAPSVPEVAYVEEYNEEAQIAQPETRQTANIATKRSKPDVAMPKGVRDEHSDSGYSSQTAATVASNGTSSLELKARTSAIKDEKNKAASKRKPAGLEKMSKSRSKSPGNSSLQRAQSNSQNHKPTKPKKPCACSECIAKARQSSIPVEAPRTIESKPKPKSKPFFSGLLRSTKPSPAQAPREAPTIPPTRARASTSQTYHAARPTSFHAGLMPEPVFIQQPYFIERQPSYPPQPMFPSPSYPPPHHTYFPPPPLVPVPQEFYGASYPNRTSQSARQWTTGHHPPTRPHSTYYEATSPIIDYGDEPVYTTIHPSTRSISRQSSHRERPGVRPDENPAHSEDYRRMPPPPRKFDTPKPQSDQRPPMARHAHTTSDAHPTPRIRRSEHDEVTKGHSSNRSPVKQTSIQHDRSRRPEARSAKRSDVTSHSAQADERDTTRPESEGNILKQRRRASIYGHETLRDLEGSIEAYQASQGTPITNSPLPIESLIHRKKTHAGGSDTSSRRSAKSGKSKTSREGSDVKSRRPSSEKDGLAVRFNPNLGVNIEMKGGTEGRTISLRPSKDGDGDMEIGIGSRGRPVGSRPPTAGRERNRRSHSYIDGQGVTQVERSATSSRAPRGYSYLDEKGQSVTHLERVGTRGSVTDSIEEEREPRIIRERITTTNRTRRDSRSGYNF